MPEQKQNAAVTFALSIDDLLKAMKVVNFERKKGPKIGTRGRVLVIDKGLQYSDMYIKLALGLGVEEV